MAGLRGRQAQVDVWWIAQRRLLGTRAALLAPSCTPALARLTPLGLGLTQVDEEGNIVDSCFKTFGCGSAIASSSVATEW